MVIGEKITGEKPLTLTEIKEFLTERKKEKELTYEQDLAMKYAKKFAKVTISQAEKIREELLKLKPFDELAKTGSALGQDEHAALNRERVRDLEYAVTKIIDILPQAKEVLLLVMPKGIELDSEAIEKVLNVTKKYSK